jgi:hypothetical protein
MTRKCRKRFSIFALVSLATHNAGHQGNAKQKSDELAMGSSGRKTDIRS